MPRTVYSNLYDIFHLKWQFTCEGLCIYEISNILAMISFEDLNEFLFKSYDSNIYCGNVKSWYLVIVMIILILKLSTNNVTYITCYADPI